MNLGLAATLPIRYLAWHFSRALGEILTLWGRSFRFVTHMTAAPLHLRTFFAPFQRIEDHSGGSIEDKLASAAANAIMRVVGMVARTVAIAFALFGYACAAIIGAAALVGWIFLPGVIVACFSFGFYAMIRFNP